MLWRVCIIQWLWSKVCRKKGHLSCMAKKCWNVWTMLSQLHQCNKETCGRICSRRIGLRLWLICWVILSFNAVKWMIQWRSSFAENELATGTLDADDCVKKQWELMVEVCCALKGQRNCSKGTVNIRVCLGNHQMKSSARWGGLIQRNACFA